MRPPEFWNIREGRDGAPVIRTLLRPLAALYAWAGRRRRRRADPLDPGIPVICVGNATLGGTGKTPVTIYLLKSLRRMGVNAHGLTRGYGGQLKGPVPVNPRHTAAEVGDEPLLIARSAPVWVAAARNEGAVAAVSEGADAIVMDDGHQNPALAKTLSLLVVDAEVGFGNGCVFPAGPLREPLTDALARTDAVILMKPSPDHDIGAVLARQLANQLVIPAYLAPRAEPPRGRLYAFAGIGRPNKFFDQLRRMGADLVEEIPFADHHKFTDTEVESLFTLAAEYGASLITTEKDHVRLPPRYRKGVYAFPVEVRFEDELTLQRLLHPIMRSAASQPGKQL
ncbi:tetraacyldisaccharide 4'-kinase [uncultured Algimonas sp.]|uniref:tetraacyldisaccharide 4'-kinase n=1 Tax=uncultured Algimonas sp. TaxID=1547920 RepID=UPI00261A17CC|nr:tetraacyldisaccharide 4'-kinase [uncultured Algimonas sp.]